MNYKRGIIMDLSKTSGLHIYLLFCVLTYVSFGKYLLIHRTMIHKYLISYLLCYNCLFEYCTVYRYVKLFSLIRHISYIMRFHLIKVDVYKSLTVFSIYVFSGLCIFLLISVQKYSQYSLF